MSSLMGLLDLGAAAIQAQNAGIATAANNSANVNTEGYSRQRVDLRANIGSPIYGGVTFSDPDRVSDELLAGRQRSIHASSGYFDALSSALLDLEGVMTAAEGDIPAGLAELFGTLNNVASSPLDPQTREAAVGAGRRLAFAFRENAGQVARSRKDADERIRDAAREASSLAAEIAKLNEAIEVRGDPVLLDNREKAALELSRLVGGKARIDEDGKMRFLLDNGAVLVDGRRSATLETTPDVALDGFVRIEVVDGSSRRDVTSSLPEGTIGADLEFRDIVTNRLTDELDQLAFDLSTSINAVHRSYAGLDGVSGRDLFLEPGAVSGAAAAMFVDPAVDADSSLLAGATLGEPSGNNDGMLALIDLQSTLSAGGGSRTFVDESVRLLSNMGQEVRDSVIDQKFHLAQKEGLEGLRDSISGVSLEEEMSRLSQFQSASQANMRFVQAIDELLSRLVDSL